MSKIYLYNMAKKLFNKHLHSVNGWTGTMLTKMFNLHFGTNVIKYDFIKEANKWEFLIKKEDMEGETYEKLEQLYIEKLPVTFRKV